MVKINGEALAVAGKTLAEYLAGTDYNPKRIAVERNGEIVPKAAYGETILQDGDVIEVVNFVGVADLSRIPEREDLQRALVARHGRAVQEKFNQATVAICGLGGLGSNIAIALARAGVGRLILTDFDRVDITNLHRQQYKATQLGEFKTEALAANLREIAPYLTIETHTTAITEENFEEILAPADVICEAFDNAEAKAMLVNGVLEKLHTKYLIAASGMAGFGSANSIQTRRITDRFYLCGDGISDVADDIGLVSSRVMICGAHEAHMVLRILSGQFEP